MSSLCGETDCSALQNHAFHTMKLTFPSLFTTSVLLGSLTHSSAKPIKKQTPLEPAFVLIGDSTTANNTVTPNSGGWGNGFCASLRPGVFCSNYGSNGATTGTIVDRGIYADALGRVEEQVGMGKAVFVTLQFGHSQSSSRRPRMKRGHQADSTV